jgi:hypothetical protein
MRDASLVQDFATIYCASPIVSRRTIALLQTAASPIFSPVPILPEKELWRKKITEAMTLFVLVIRTLLGTVSIQICDGAGNKVVDFIQLSCLVSDDASTLRRNQRLDS